jgi:hypothetical protein
VGSSSSSTRQSRSSQRASTTFCWLPPDSVPDLPVDVGRPDLEGGDLLPGGLGPADRDRKPARANRARLDRLTFREDGLAEQQALALALLGASPTPAATAAATSPGRSRRPPTRTVPASARRAP